MSLSTNTLLFCVVFHEFTLNYYARSAECLEVCIFRGFVREPHCSILSNGRDSRDLFTRQRISNKRAFLHLAA